MHFYCQSCKKFPEAPEKIFRGSRKNFPVFHEEFWPVSRDHSACCFKVVSRDHSACRFKVIWPVPRFAFVPKWTKLPAEKIDKAMGWQGPLCHLEKSYSAQSAYWTHWTKLHYFNELSVFWPFEVHGKRPVFTMWECRFFSFSSCVASEGKNTAFPGFAGKLKNIGTLVNQRHKRAE